MEAATETIRPSAPERSERGAAARKRVPRSSHGAWEPGADRADPVDILERQSADRLPDLVPLRYARMGVSAFTFYRGAAGIMAADLGTTPESGIWVQACGDAHLSNFGTFASPRRDMVFDVNDFDETLPGPWEWDLKRLVASFEIAGRDLQLAKDVRRDVVRTASRTYREVMRELSTQTNLDVWYRRVEVEEIRERFAGEASAKERRRYEKALEKARRKTSMRAFSKLTTEVDGELRIASDPPVLLPLEDIFAGSLLEIARTRIEAVIESYRTTLSPDIEHLLSGYRFVHAARKVVGVGSVGTRAWVALFVGRDEGDPLFLQVKEAQASVLEPYTAASRYAHQGQRVVEGQRLMQATGDIMLGWLTARGPDDVERDFYVRQLWDQKGSAEIETMSPQTLKRYAELCGAIMARAHARSGDRIAIAGYVGRSDSLDKAMSSFADAYADQNERDYEAFQQAIADGRITASFEGAER